MSKSFGNHFIVYPTVVFLNRFDCKHAMDVSKLSAALRSRDNRCYFIRLFCDNFTLKLYILCVVATRHQSLWCTVLSITLNLNCRLKETIYHIYTNGSMNVSCQCQRFNECSLQCLLFHEFKLNNFSVRLYMQAF